MTRLRYWALLSAVLLCSTSAAADPSDAPAPVYPRLPQLLLPGPRSVCKTDAGLPLGDWELGGSEGIRCRDLPPGRFLDEPAYQELDLEMRRLQAAETNLTAQNQSLRESVSSWQPGWKTVLVVFAVGVAGGVTAYHYAQ